MQVSYNSLHSSDVQGIDATILISTGPGCLRIQSTDNSSHLRDVKGVYLTVAIGVTGIARCDWAVKPTPWN